MLCIATVNIGDLAVDQIVDVDPENPVIERYLRAHFLQPLDHQPMPPESRPEPARRKVRDTPQA